ncbi:type II toxin-antitoxin system ParD family antitoxin [Burkholderia sp. Ac-20345]|uniref:type II toxin-antitoxin system ParD family antitoxin n=1 Tax=Burkholderia TaxID=32008 RepID=UPI001453F1CF|nr:MULTISPECIES: type II toxin-antitoxin system ParD family antitoxin [Burkholderia]MBN3783521.1 type II toxin-antitoxin system ParD family antitoxin [Burkholderia sp. Ac-20345]VWB24815.1 addiction module antidote protein [Burkholderia lata]
MSRYTSVYLGDHFAEFVDAQVQSGRYGSASDVVRAGSRLLESQETQARALQEALKAGEASGEPKPFDREAFLARMRPTHDG